MRIFIVILVLINISTNSFSQSPPSIAELENRMKTENDTSKIITMNEIAGMYANRQMFDSNYYWIDKVFRLSEKAGFQKGLAMGHNGFGVIAMVKGEYKKSMEHFFKALAIAEKNGMTRHIMMISSNIASIHITQQEYQQAIPLLSFHAHTF